MKVVKRILLNGGTSCWSTVDLLRLYFRRLRLFMNHVLLWFSPSFDYLFASNSQLKHTFSIPTSFINYLLLFWGFDYVICALIIFTFSYFIMLGKIFCMILSLQKLVIACCEMAESLLRSKYGKEIIYEVILLSFFMQL